MEKLVKAYENRVRMSAGLREYINLIEEEIMDCCVAEMHIKVGENHYFTKYSSNECLWLFAKVDGEDYLLSEKGAPRFFSVGHEYEFTYYRATNVMKLLFVKDLPTIVRVIAESLEQEAGEIAEGLSKIGVVID